MFGSRSTTRRHTTSQGTYRKNRIRGLRSAINNPRTTRAGRAEAKTELVAMGARPNKPTLGTRIRRLLHLPARSHHRNKHHTTHHTTTTYHV